MFARSDASISFPDPHITKMAFIVCSIHPTNALYVVDHELTKRYFRQGSLWGGTGISLCFLLFRLFVRLNAFQHLYSDDYIIIAAWVMKLVTDILWQINVPILYEYFAIVAGKKPLDVSFVNKSTTLLRTAMILNIHFYSTLWLVKLSILMFFRRLGSKVKGQKIWWWCILVFTVLAWVACIADIRYKCYLNSLEVIICEFFPTRSWTLKFTGTEMHPRLQTSW